MANNFVKKKNNFGLLRMFSTGDAMRMIDSVSDPLQGSASAAAPDLKKSRRQKGDRRSQTAVTGVDRLPPHALEAEQGVLGCALLDPNQCIGECIEKLKDDGKSAFYDLRHQTIYETLSEMFNAREAIERYQALHSPAGEVAPPPPS